MEEETLETLSNCGELATNTDQTQEPLLKEDDEVENQNRETPSSDQKKRTNPILQKLDSLSTQVQIMKKEQTNLSNEAKSIADDCVIYPEVWAALRDLGSENENLKKKYQEEFLERKQLYNEVIELKGNIRVFCRCRPLSQSEIANGCSSVVDFGSSHHNELQIVNTDNSKKQFKFDHVFRPDDDQEAVFAETSPVVTSVLDGYNVCIFAYGQTGTGKTFTMEGTPENRGVNYRTLEELFRISKLRSGTMQYKLFVSMLEVYNEKIRDLLVDNSDQVTNKLEIKQSAEGTQEVPGLFEAPVDNIDEVWEQLKVGSQNRSVGSTNANELSSRSHCLLRVTVKGENLVNGQKTRSHLWLVDLAGSERVGRIEVEGERLKESQFINKSLSALGDVISSLASKTPHIPYRNSKLTHLLQSSLGGDCKTLMFVQISPSSADLGETLCSLNFASRVRGIEHGPVRKHADPDELFKHKQMTEKLRQYEKETVKLQNSFQSLQLRFAAREQLCKSLQEKTRDLENQLAEERKIRMQQESRVSASSAKLSSLSYLQQSQNHPKEKKPPLGPSKLRPPLRGITNISLPSTLNKSDTQLFSSGAREDKENISRTTTTKKSLMMPRRVSIGVRPSAKMQSHQSRRRASIATIYPESQSSLSMMTPANTSNAGRMLHQSQRRASIATIYPESQSSLSMMTPANTSNAGRMLHQSQRRVSIANVYQMSQSSLSMMTPGQSSTARRMSRQPQRRVSIATSSHQEPRFPSMMTLMTPTKTGNGGATSRLSFLRPPRKISAMFSPLPPHLRSSSTTVREDSPARGKNSLVGSPPTQIGSWKPKHPTVVALHKRHFVWSPLKQKALKNESKPMPSSKSSDVWK